VGKNCIRDAPTTEKAEGKHKWIDTTLEPPEMHQTAWRGQGEATMGKNPLRAPRDALTPIRVDAVTSYLGFVRLYNQRRV